MIGLEEIAKDLTQQTFLRAYVAKDRYKPTGPPGAWLYRIAHNLTMDYIRKEKSSQKYVSKFKQESFTTSDIARSEARVMISKAMRFLNKEEREVIQLYYFEDLSDDLIGKKLGIHDSNIYRRRIHAIQKMRDQLGVVI